MYSRWRIQKQAAIWCNLKVPALREQPRRSYWQTFCIITHEGFIIKETEDQSVKCTSASFIKYCSPYFSTLKSIFSQLKAGNPDERLFAGNAGRLKQVAVMHCNFQGVIITPLVGLI